VAATGSRDRRGERFWRASPGTKIGAFGLEVPSARALSTVIIHALPRFYRNRVATEQVSPGCDALEHVERQLEGLRHVGINRWEAIDPEEGDRKGGLTGLRTEQVVAGAKGDQVRQCPCLAARYKLSSFVLNRLSIDSRDRNILWHVPLASAWNH
jgi:hypothetical protein